LCFSGLRDVRNRGNEHLYCEYVASRGGTLRVDYFLRFIKALAAIGALTQAGIGRFGIAVALQCSVAQIILTDRIADADVHGCSNHSCEAFAEANV
jgi:hypothetical protein